MKRKEKLTPKKPKKWYKPHPRRIRSLSEYLAAVEALILPGTDYWFRGQSDFDLLKPSALRGDSEETINRCLGLLGEFKRVAVLKHNRPPEQSDELGWLQLAQHFGVPTRLLDWSENPLVGLYFACEGVLKEKRKPKDGAVFLLNPIHLTPWDGKKEQIRDYLNLDASERKRGRFGTMAIRPVWNSDRLVAQRGTFTLHGNRQFALTKEEAPSLVMFKIAGDKREFILQQLEKIGVDEFSLFPELEHVSKYLQRRGRLI